MDFSVLGVNVAVIAAIVGLTMVIKKADPGGRLKRFYVLIPGVLGILAAVALTDPWSWPQFIINGLVYGGLSAWAYDFKRIFTAVEDVPKEEPPRPDNVGVEAKQTSAATGLQGDDL